MAKKKADKSEYVHQGEKIKDSLTIRDLNWTEKQKQFIEIALDKKTKIILLKGAAGTSKSLLSVYCGLKLLNEKKISDIIYVRSAVESSDSKLGFLPGDVDDKLSFYNLPFFDKLEELLPSSEIDKLKKEEKISMFPINYCRGMSWNAKLIIFDESQNSSRKEIVTVLTRIGKYSKCFILADPTQTDLPSSKAGGFCDIFNKLSDQESKDMGIVTFEFTNDDIVRSELVKFLVKKLGN
jgi:phosphate starvation-inducible PhoH-like protein